MPVIVGGGGGTTTIVTTSNYFNPTKADYVQTNEPSSAIEGETWYKSDTDEMFIYQ